MLKQFRSRVVPVAMVAVVAFFGLAGPAQAAAAGIPVSHLDSATGGARSVTMTGWAFDRDHLSGERIDVWQTAPGHRAVSSTATTISRPDVNRAYRVSGVHGWSITFAATPGHGTYCAYAINVGPGGNPLIGCRTVNIGADFAPNGHLDFAGVDSPVSVRLSGWAFDRDGLNVAQRVEFRTKDDQGYGSTTTSVSRPDVNRAFGLVGRHGWSWTFVLNRPETICVYAMNVGPTRPATLIGCAKIAPPLPLTQPVDQLTGISTAHEVTLTWRHAGTIPYSRIEVGGVMADSPSGSGDAVKLADLPGTATSFTQTGLLSGVMYTYRVTTFNAQGYGSDQFKHVYTQPTACVTACAWGRGALGAGPAAPTVVQYPLPVASLAGTKSIVGMSAYAGLALTSDGKVHSWGANQQGELGDGSTTPSTEPVTVTALSNITAIAAGDSTGYALRSDGSVWAWGDDGPNGGRLGAGHPIGPSLTPIQVTALPTIVAISAGGGEALALADDGSVWAWGDNACLTAGAPSGSGGPFRVSGLPPIASISADGITEFAIDHNGSLWAWGNNTYGQLGNGAFGGNRADPALVVGLTGVTSVSARQRRVVAVRTDGTVWTWGNNQQGLLGDGTTTSRAAPVQVPGLNSAVQSALGGVTTYVLRADGSVWAWGVNSGSQLGDGQTSDSLTPVQVWGLTGMTTIGAGVSTGYAAR